MQLDDRGNKILEELVSNPSITSKDVEKKYDLTSRQLGYSFNKINDWLKGENLPLIKRTKQGNFIIDKFIIKHLNNEGDTESLEKSILSEEQRVYIALMMLLSNDEISLIHFTTELEVSKNTALSDLKRAQDFVKKYNLCIRYSRRSGYLLEGDEFIIRKLLIKVTYRILEMPQGSDRLCQTADIQKKEINKLNQRISKVEKKLKLKFTDEKVASLPFTLSLVLGRIEKRKEISSFYIKYEELSDTKEYHATEYILKEIKNIPMKERLFITLHLLTANVYWSNDLTEDVIPNLKQTLNEMLNQFEKMACVFIQDKEQLLNKLLLHVKPAYYRIKYHLTEIKHDQKNISKEFLALQHVVQKSTKPLENLIGMAIPESETTYLTMLIGGWLTRQGDSIQEKIKAIVVCPKGVSVSRLMLSELRELFPEFIFLDSLSIREFQQYTLDYDIVFSPTFLGTDKKLFIASSILEYEEKQRLRKQVLMQLNGYAPNQLDLETILNIVEKHAVINNRRSLAIDLEHHFNHQQQVDDNSHYVDYPSPNLNELIREDTITILDSVPSWEDALKVASRPLLNNKNITGNYVETMIDNKADPYIVISPNTAIPHAAPEEGVKELSMSLLSMKQGVEFAKDYTIQLIIVIAAVDKEQHIQPLSQLMKIVANDKYRKLLINAESKKEIYEIIQDGIFRWGKE